MASIKAITGLNTVVKNLTKAKKNIAAGVGRGLKKGGLHLQRKSKNAHVAGTTDYVVAFVHLLSRQGSK